MQLPEVAVSALLLQDRVSNENGPDSGFYYWLCRQRNRNSLRSREHSPSYNYCSFCIFFLQLASSLLIKDGQFSVHVGVLT